MRFLGIDYGTKYMGISISDKTNTISSSLKVISYTDLEEVYSEIGDIIKDNLITDVILGFPLNMNGTKSKRCEEVLLFKEEISKRFNVNTDIMDERLTSVLANNMLINNNTSRKKRKTVVDKISAAIILQSYLDRRNNAR